MIFKDHHMILIDVMKNGKGDYWITFCFNCLNLGFLLMDPNVLAVLIATRTTKNFSQTNRL